MYLLVGLGNIGKEYEKTRHNYGFLLIDNIISNFDFICQGKKFKSEYFCGEIAGHKIIALKPQTFMNLSGNAVQEAMNFFKIPLAKLIILHDDLDIPLGKIKYKIGGGCAGHNGLKSIDEVVGNNYARIRLGIGRPTNLNIEIADYVLAKFSKEELIYVENLNDKICKNIAELLNGDSANFLNKIYL